MGTALYIAPELQSRRKGPRNSAKADMYSLGVRLEYTSHCTTRRLTVFQIVFFEMNYFFKTDSERNKVIPELRLPSIVFPSDWDPKRSRQRQSTH